jgi:hypothetical protein
MASSLSTHYNAVSVPDSVPRRPRPPLRGENRCRAAGYYTSASAFWSHAGLAARSLEDACPALTRRLRTWDKGGHRPRRRHGPNRRKPAVDGQPRGRPSAASAPPARPARRRHSTTLLVWTSSDSAAFARASTIALAGEGRAAGIARACVVGVELRMRPAVGVCSIGYDELIAALLLRRQRGHAAQPAPGLWNGRFPQVNPERNHHGAGLPVRAAAAADLTWLERDCRLAGEAGVGHDVIVALDALAWDDFHNWSGVAAETAAALPKIVLWGRARTLVSGANRMYRLHTHGG